MSMNLATAVEFQAEIARLEAEIKRLRLTEAEHESLSRAARWLEGFPYGDSDTLRGLLKRAKEGDR